MENLYEKFESITTFIFDVDGVLSDGTVLVTDEGHQLRRFWIKDGFAVTHALKMGFRVAFISAGNEESVRKRLEYLGVKDIFLGTKDKETVFSHYVQEHGLNADKILYMGDDIADLAPLRMAGISACPANASNDILNRCAYVSPKNGGEGAVRDILEKVLKAQDKWPV